MRGLFLKVIAVVLISGNAMSETISLQCDRLFLAVNPDSADLQRVCNEDTPYSEIGENFSWNSRCLHQNDSYDVTLRAKYYPTDKMLMVDAAFLESSIPQGKVLESRSIQVSVQPEVEFHIYLNSDDWERREVYRLDPTIDYLESSYVIHRRAVELGVQRPSVEQAVVHCKVANP